MKQKQRQTTNDPRYHSSFGTFYEKRVGFYIHRSSVVDILEVVTRFSGLCRCGEVAVVVVLER